MKNASATTIADHTAAIARLTAATDISRFAEAYDFQQLDTPGFPDDLADGNYVDGYFLATVRSGELTVTQIHQLPPATFALWQEHETATRGPGQPAIGKPFPVRLATWRRAMIARDAEAAGVPDAELIRWLIATAYVHLGEVASAAGVTRTELIRSRVTSGRRTR